jgi:hypothetical protein
MVTTFILKIGLVEIHFFEFKNPNPLKNYGQIYILLNAINDY